MTDHDAPAWTEDRCTCGHPESSHSGMTGYCVPCQGIQSYGSSGGLDPPCMRYQWDGEPRRRTW